MTRFVTTFLITPSLIILKIVDINFFNNSSYLVELRCSQPNLVTTFHFSYFKFKSNTLSIINFIPN